MLGERLKAARLSMGLTQRKLAGMCDISAMAISKYERNLDMPSSRVLLRLAKALESPIDYFFRPLTVKLSEPMYRCRATFSARSSRSCRSCRQMVCTIFRRTHNRPSS